MNRKWKKGLVLWALILVLVFTCACTPDDSDFTDLTVREATGTNGVVASASAYASKAGLEILEAGGNAFDAAVAVAFALGVVEPNASGVGGGGIMVAFDAESGNYYNYNFREFVPEAGTAATYGTAAALDDGITSVGVPMEVAGLTKIHADLGSGNLTLAQVMAPAIRYAEEGFTIESTLAAAIRDNLKVVLQSEEETKPVFTDGIEPLSEGMTLIQTDYANVLKEIANKGNEGFYEGWVAEAIIDAMEAQGGLVTQEDLKYASENYPKITQPLTGKYNGYDIITADLPSSGGIILMEALNMLEYYENSTGQTLMDLGHNSAEYLHAVGTAMQLGFGDKRKYIADRDFVDVPLQGLMSKTYAADRWNECFDPDQAFVMTSSDAYGDPWKYQAESSNVAATDNQDFDEHFSTTSFSVADKEGNIVSVTQTINHFWGSGVVPKDCGFFLNNQLSSFSLSTGSVHYVEPFKQPVSHIMPTILMKDGNPFATLGSPGSMRIPSAVIQVALNLMEFDMDMQEAIEAARIYSYAVSSSDPVSDKKWMEVESTIGESVIGELEAKNYYITTYDGANLYFGGVQGIKFNYDESGNLVSMTGGADIRRDGKALAF